MDIQTIALIVPLATTHVGGNYDFNNHNPGLGIELSTDSIAYSALYLKSNSFRRDSVYLAGSYLIKKDNFTYSFGLALANGYEELYKSGYLMTPVVSIQYKDFRIVTTYPTAGIACQSGDVCGDFINLQYVYEF